MDRVQPTTAAGVRCTVGNGSTAGALVQVGDLHRLQVLDRIDNNQACMQESTRHATILGSRHG
jgi:hypothetical protein